MKLDDALRGVTRLGIDTPLFIYFIEKNPTYLNLVREVARRVDAGDITGRVSTIALAEVLPVPIRAGDAVVEREYRSLLLRSRNLAAVPVDVAVAERAAVLRANYNLKTPDALHIGSALVAGCDAFLTNDMGFRRVTDIRILILDDLTL